MHLSCIPFETTDWSSVEPSGRPRETGLARWRTRDLESIRVRTVEYTPGYRADRQCTKVHRLLRLDGEPPAELADGRRFILAPGMSRHVAVD